MSDSDNPDAAGNAAQIAYWNDRAGPTWATFQERLDALFAPLTDIALAATAAQAGERVIDAGCGCGATLIELARRVGPSGHVLGIDVSEPMSARARERIAAAQLTWAESLVADAATHRFAPGRSDLLFSRFGVMFFADPVGAFANLRRAMRPNGRLVCAVWRPLAENPWMHVPLNAARPLLPAEQQSDPAAPGPFALADPERVRGILAGAGWREAGFARHDVPMRLAGPGRIEEAAEFATRIGPLARALAQTDPELRLAARQVVAAALRPLDGPDGISLLGAIWIVSARA